MITAHLTETEIQLYVAEPEKTHGAWKAHVQGCAVCRAKADNYVLLFRGIYSEARPAFNFDLSALVLEQLPAPQRTFSWATVMVWVLSLSIAAIAAALFWSPMLGVIKSVSGALLAAAATGAGVILVFQAVEMIKEHQKRMETLLQKTLQL